MRNMSKKNKEKRDKASVVVVSLIVIFNSLIYFFVPQALCNNIKFSLLIIIVSVLFIVVSALIDWFVFEEIFEIFGALIIIAMLSVIPLIVIIGITSLFIHKDMPDNLLTLISLLQVSVIGFIETIVKWILSKKEGDNNDTNVPS